MSAGATITTIGKTIEALAPIAAAVNPIAGLLVIAVGETVQFIGGGISAGLEVDAQLLADVTIALGSAKQRRGETATAHDARTAETRRLAAEAKARADEPTVDLRHPTGAPGADTKE